MRSAVSSIYIALVVSLQLFAQPQPSDAKKPTVSRKVFASRLKEEFFVEIDSNHVSIENAQQKEFIFGHLAYLKNLRTITFDAVDLVKDDLRVLARFPHVTHVELKDYRSWKLTGLISLLSPLKTLETISLNGCGVTWNEVKDPPAFKLRRLELHRTKIDAAGIRRLCGISTLQEIQISLCRASDDDLKSLNHITNLKSISIYNCFGVTGEFLADLRGLTELQQFNFIGRLHAEYARHMANFPELRSTTINSHERLDEKWYVAIGKNCKKLKTIHLRWQGADRKKIELLSSLPQMTDLELHSDEGAGSFSVDQAKVSSEPGIMQTLARLKKLEKLNLSGAYHLNAEDGAAITSLTNLRELQLRGFTFETSVFENLDQLANLQVLRFYESKPLTKSDVDQIGKLRNLKWLDLTNVAVAPGADLSQLANLTKLEKVNFSNCSLNDDDMAFAKGTPNLKEIFLDANRITDVGLARLKHATKIETMSIDRLYVNGKGFAEWPADHAIHTLLIDQCSISNKGLQAISRLQNLKILSINVSRLFGKTEFDVACLAKAKSLESVLLYGRCETTQESMDQLKKLRPGFDISCPIQ